MWIEYSRLSHDGSSFALVTIIVSVSQFKVMYLINGFNVHIFVT